MNEKQLIQELYEALKDTLDKLQKHEPGTVFVNAIIVVEKTKIYLGK